MADYADFREMDYANYKHGDLTEKIIKCYYKVYNTLGFGFLEKVYERALAFELRKSGLSVQIQVPVDVFYEEENVGKYFADLLVDHSVIIELKAGEHLAEEHEAQLLNYLKATNIEIGLLLNFGLKPAIRRKIYSNK